MEKARLEDTAFLDGFLKAALRNNPDLFDRYEEEKSLAVQRLSSHPAHDLTELYDGMIQLLRRPDDDETPPSTIQ